MSYFAIYCLIGIASIIALFLVTHLFEEIKKKEIEMQKLQEKVILQDLEIEVLRGRLKIARGSMIRRENQ